MTITEIKQIIQQELPQALAQDPAIRDFILRTVSEYYAGKPETDTKFDRILADFERDREVQSPQPNFWLEHTLWIAMVPFFL